MKETLKRYMESCSALTDRELNGLLRSHPELPKTLRESMRYSIFAGGKRLRPTLVMAAAEACGLPARKAGKTAAALEMIHTYSLIHDDLPAMDDDDLRRGKPTNHKVYGEAIAILAGDGLLTSAFEAAAANAAELRLSAAAASELIRAIAAGAGAKGMVGGQVADLEAEQWKTRNHGFNPEKTLRYIHLHKTAALITASLEAGAILAEAAPKRRAALQRYGRAVGLAFQIADDILDVVGDKKKLGKRGSDAKNEKLTYVSLYGLDRARNEAESLVKTARLALAPFGRRAAPLRELADYIVSRES